MTEESPSAWALLPLPGQSTAAAYLTGPLAKQYRLIVDILDDERHVSLTGVGFDELSVLIRRRLPDDGLDAANRSMVMNLLRQFDLDVLLAGLAARAADAGGWIDPIGDAAAWHRAWESGGVVCDGVSSQVLVLNLPLTGSGPAASLAAVRGEPVWLTLRALSAQPLTLSDEVPDVFVCENPAIVEAAADRYGTASRPLVCTFGQPNLATMRLLSALAPAATLRVRADGDTVGWGIVERLLRLSGARTWRMPEGFDRYEEEILDELLVDLAPVD